MIFLAFVCSILGIIASGITSGGYFIQKCTHLLAETESTVLWIALLALSIIRHMKQKKVETSKRYALTLLENSRTNSDEVLFESKISRRS
ncbi:hypothetical protein EB796_011964 [Bugula neritina]|uniref:Uncharacterized protein n=1 Tax=Bugula neritina TaxID=10212 RepID=A0A7J7JUU0_BUGNE|nr:hypothetical protein EB796_011964 [Bugula neritina]